MKCLPTFITVLLTVRLKPSFTDLYSAEEGCSATTLKTSPVTILSHSRGRVKSEKVRRGQHRKMSDNQSKFVLVSSCWIEPLHPEKI